MIINENTKSLEEKVYLTLEEEIISGYYSRGEALTEMSLCKRLGVSRTPVRSALHRLSEDGLLEISPNRGAVVIGVTEDDLTDAYKIRMRLEGLASALATERITEEEKTSLKETLELSEFYLSKGDTEKLKELDTDFHKVIYKASGSRILCKILSELHRNIRSYRKISLSAPGRLEHSIKEHREIFSAIERGDFNEAEQLTALHVKRAMENTIAAIKHD